MGQHGTFNNITYGVNTFNFSFQVLINGDLPATLFNSDADLIQP
jgi:hypothetical protein